MICHRCHEDFDNSGSDGKGFKSTRIQQSSADGEWYCMKCAITIYNEEQK